MSHLKKPDKSGQNGATEIWKDESFIEEANRYYIEDDFDEETISINSSNTIQELEELTLKNPGNEELYLTLVKKYLSSKLPNNKQLSLAALSEALDQNPKSPKVFFLNFQQHRIRK